MPLRSALMIPRRKAHSDHRVLQVDRPIAEHRPALDNEEITTGQYAMCHSIVMVLNTFGITAPTRSRLTLIRAPILRLSVWTPDR
jgi:hypothetical protein